MALASLSKLLESFSAQGKELLRRYIPLGHAERAVAPADELEALAHALLSGRGEASGTALASDLLRAYEVAAADDRTTFFQRLATGFAPDRAGVEAAWARYRQEGDKALPVLAAAVEAPRQELFRRINLAPGGTAALVRMRADLLARLKTTPGLDAVDADLVHLLQSWFNRGFLKMEAISWSSPASLLERVIRYEAVHDIQGWQDLRSRLDPPDRRCFAFFHPAMPGEPLIFVEVALTQGVATSIQQVLRADRPMIAAEDATTAIFYSISNCQPGLRGISFGHFLIKQVANDLRSALPKLSVFATLSPLPGFRAYLDRSGADTMARGALEADAIRYLTEAKTRDGKPLDPVARFHLGNGARLEQLNWQADTSAKGMQQSAGLMVNYLYDLSRIEENHEAYAHRGAVATGEPFRQLAKAHKLPGAA